MPRSKVVIKTLDDDGEPRDVAHISLDDSDRVMCDREDMLREWARTGIVGRSSEGRLYPQDGTRFMAELPYMYKSPYLWAEPSTDLQQHK